MGQIVIYVDQGVDGGALRHVVKSLQKEVDLSQHPLRRMDAKAIKQEEWEKTTTLLVVPGGRDLYYHSALGKEGTARIRQFVFQGGTYMGLCAGAYFGSSEIEFEKGSPLEVCGKRHLAFYPGLAKGPAYKHNPYSYDSDRGSTAAFITSSLGTTHAYFNGGCYFENTHEFPHIEVIASYSDLDGEPAAIIACPFGKGKVFLSGVHVEYSSDFLLRGTPNMDRIFPILEKSEDARRGLFRELLRKSGLSLQKA